MFLFGSHDCLSEGSTFQAEAMFLRASIIETLFLKHLLFSLGMSTDGVKALFHGRSQGDVGQSHSGLRLTNGALSR